MRKMLILFFIILGIVKTSFSQSNDITIQKTKDGKYVAVKLEKISKITQDSFIIETTRQKIVTVIDFIDKRVPEGMKIKLILNPNKKIRIEDNLFTFTSTYYYSKDFSLTRIRVSNFVVFKDRKISFIPETSPKQIAWEFIMFAFVSLLFGLIMAVLRFQREDYFNNDVPIWFSIMCIVGIIFGIGFSTYVNFGIVGYVSFIIIGIIASIIFAFVIVETIDNANDDGEYNIIYPFSTGVAILSLTAWMFSGNLLVPVALCLIFISSFFLTLGILKIIKKIRNRFK